MRNWDNRLFLGALPGMWESFDSSIDDIRTHEIHTVVSLVSVDEIAFQSPEYADWRRSPQYEKDNTIHGVEMWAVPISNHGAPDGKEVLEFWDAAVISAQSIENGDGVFAHCSAGIGRTGMFAVGVVMALGHSFENAIAAVNATGPGPEAEEQKDFVVPGPPPSLVYPNIPVFYS